MEKSIAVIYGSSRSNGNTRKIVDYYKSITPSVDIFDLNDYNIGYYDYSFKNANDDFKTFYNQILNYHTLVFATPIYWYTMSAQMKTFFDRISDMLQGENKILGRRLKGKNMLVISCGSDSEIFNGFDMPFRESANYLDMHYKGHVHTWLENDGNISNKVKSNLKTLL